MTLSQLQEAAAALAAEEAAAAAGGGAAGSSSLFTFKAGSVERMASLATWHEGVTILFADIVGEWVVQRR